MPSNVPNKPTVDFLFPAIIVDTVVYEKSSSYTGTYQPIEPGKKFSALNHSVKEAADYAGKIFLGQQAGEDNEFQKRIWADPPTAQDVYNYDVEYSDENPSFPIFKRRYLILRDYYGAGAPLGPLTKNSFFNGIYAIRLTAAGSGYSKPVVTITDVGGGTGASTTVVLNDDGTIAKITLRVEGANYVTPVVAIADSAGGTGSGATAVAIKQGSGCQLTEERVVQAQAPWNSLYIMVERTYETLDGPVRLDYNTDPETQISNQVALQRIVTAEIAEPNPSLGENISIKHLSTAVSEITTETINAAKMDAYYRAFSSNVEIKLPRVLTGITVVWDTTTAAGAYTESGSGATAGTNNSISMNSSGRANGSASVLPELIPAWDPRTFGRKPVVDLEFFMVKNSTAADAFTKATAVASTFFGMAVTINDWPNFESIEHTFVIVGQKVSVSAEATSRVSASIAADGSSVSSAAGVGGSIDLGSSVRPITIPECIHGAITLSSATNSESVTATAATSWTGSGDFPSLAPSASQGATAAGFVTPTSLAATNVTGYPGSGFYAETYESRAYKNGYDAFRFRVFDFSTL